ncbi:MAG TPA: ABC transporter substrate-binding protein [Roseateles sp.]|uniref:ABC transporter substrate-binding protein n=1 Tax=Roseateles sp. TaxID=1971397 RepID=UPI002ED9146B
MKRLLTVFLLLSALLLPAAAGTLRVALQLEPPLLDPTVGAAAPISEVVYGNVFEGLVVLAEDGSAQPRLAEHWDVSADGLALSFRLRTGARFHDGTPFDAAVAKFALERARADGSANPQRSLLAAVDRITAPDAHTLVLHLKRRDGSLLQSLGSAAFVMVAPGSVATNPTAPNGTGPWRFARWQRGNAIELTRFEGYWGEKARLDALRYRFIADPSAAYAAVMAGDVDLFANFPAPEHLAQIRADRRFEVRAGLSEGETLLSINHRRAPLQQLAVRRAIAAAIDRQALIDGAMFGFGQPIGSHFSPRHAAYVDLTGQSPHDPAHARALLAEAHWPADRVLSLKLPPTAYARRGGEILAAQMAAVGIRTRVENLEWAQWLDQVFVRHDFDLTVIVHAEPLDYGIYGRDDYYFGYRSDRVKSLLRQLDDQSDEAERRASLQSLQRQLSDDAVNGFLFQYPRLLVQRAGLAGVHVNAVGSLELAGATLPGAEAARAQDHGGLPHGIALGALALLALGIARLAWRAEPRWLVARLASLALTLAVASALIFALVQIAPGDPARYVLGMQADEQAVAALREQLGLNAPALTRYGRWIGALLRGDLGDSLTYRLPVRVLLAERLPLTVPLAALALGLAIALALPAALLAARWPGGKVDRAVGAFSQLGVSVPDFWLGVMGAWLFAVVLRWVPAGGFPGWDAGLSEGLRALALPALALALPQAAILTRVLRAALAELAHAEFLRTARAKGASRWRALWRHALPNTASPVLTLLGLQTAYLLAGSVIVENVFFLPGVGRLLFQGVTAHDLVLVQSLVLVLVALGVSVSALVELAARVADPRLARRGAGA